MKALNFINVKINKKVKRKTSRQAANSKSSRDNKQNKFTIRRTAKIKKI